MTYVVMTFLVLVAGVTQTLLPPLAFLGQAKWPLLMGVVVYYALHRDSGVMLTAAVLAGVVQDALSPVPLGTTSACFCVGGWLMGRFRSVVVTEAVVTPAFFGGLGGCAFTAVMYGLLVGQGRLGLPPGGALLKTLGTGVLAAIGTPVVFVVGLRLDRLVGNIEAKEVVDEYEFAHRR